MWEEGRTSKGGGGRDERGLYRANRGGHRVRRRWKASKEGYVGRKRGTIWGQYSANRGGRKEEKRWKGSRWIQEGIEVDMKERKWGGLIKNLCTTDAVFNITSTIIIRTINITPTIMSEG